MMRCSAICSLLFIAIFAQAASAQFGGGGFGYPGPGGGFIEEPPLSVFNDKVRRFKFDLEDQLVTTETAEEFKVLYRDRNDAKIIGAYADAYTNTLVVVGPPDSEHSIRQTLAEWIVARQSAAPEPLVMQQRKLEYRRRNLLRTLASVEVEAVGAEAEKAKALSDVIKELRGELKVVEAQIKVVERYVDELDNNADPFAEDDGFDEPDPFADGDPFSADF